MLKASYDKECMKKIKVLWYSDFLIPTGFGNVAEEIISRLMKLDKYEFTIVAISHDGTPINTPKSPYYKFKDLVVYPALWGKDKLGFQRVLNMLSAEDFDIFFSLMDIFITNPIEQYIAQLKAIKKFSRVFYFPVDGDMDPKWMEQSDSIDYPITYTNFGVQTIAGYNKKLANRCSIVYHGVDTNAFYPFVLDKERVEVRKTYFGADPDHFIITNVNRNIQRKDLLRTVVAFLKVKERIPKAKLYLNTNVMEFTEKEATGHDILSFIKKYVPQEIQKDISYPNPDAMHLITKDVLRQIYAASDVVVSTSTGEGWGLSTVESQACKIPVVMPRNTASIEIIGKHEERGLLAKCSDFTIFPRWDHGLIRPTTDVNDLADKICQVHYYPETAKDRAEAAYAWIKENCDWDKIVKRWDEIFSEAYAKNNKESWRNKVS